MARSDKLDRWGVSLRVHGSKLHIDASDLQPKIDAFTFALRTLNLAYKNLPPAVRERVKISIGVQAPDDEDDDRCPPSM